MKSYSALFLVMAAAVILMSVSAYAGTITVGKWNFNEGSGLIAHDSTVYGNNGSLGNGIVSLPVWTAGHEGGGLQFGPSNSRYVIIPNSPSLNITGASIIMDAWINRTATDPNTKRYVIMDKNYYGMDIKADKLRTYLQLVKPGGTNAQFLSTPSASSIPAGVWTHITSTYDGRYIKMYINDVLDANVTDITAGGIYAEGATIVPLVTRPLTIGNGTLTLNLGFNGIIDEVKIGVTMADCAAVISANLGMPMDFNHDCYVDFKDIAAFTGAWMLCDNPTDTGCTN